ncbi:MAG: DUF512 domain-containing protein [Clostridia bacterium]|nr:DUF512 domain-containing protein [Clostridia bacterium]
MVKVKQVARRGLAREYGIEKGDEILFVNGFEVKDELDLLYAEALEQVELTVRDKRCGAERSILVQKESGEEWGMTFEPAEKIKTCHNHCLFCFVDQMPKGMRESLYVKDDDYAMSFTCGNFVTLTNLEESDEERIVRLRLSPLYISVHATNPEVRVKLLRNRFAGRVLEQISRFAKAGIEMHCQAVIVPGINDGAELTRTARELFALYPAVKDLAVVPTGLTKYREGLFEIPDPDKEYARSFLKQVDELNAEFGVNFVLPADEYFIKAEEQMKPAEFYGEFEQIENGIGMTAKFLGEVNSALLELGNRKLKKPKKAIIVSGVSAAKTNREVAKKIQNAVQGLMVEVLPVKNEFFGETVTCTGLLTGKDVINALLDYERAGNRADLVVLAGNMTMEFSPVFLCGTTLDQMRKKIKFAKIEINRNGGYGLVELLSRGSK